MAYPTDPKKRAIAKAKRAARYAANKARYAQQNAAWRAANADRKKESDKAYAAANPESNRRATAKYRKANPEKMAAMRDTWLAANVDHMQAWSRQYYQLNKTRFAANAARWRLANPERARAISRQNAQNMRMVRRLRRPLWTGELDALAFREAADLALRRELVTNREWQIDHLLPLQAELVSGLHCAVNLQVIPAQLNRAKRNRLWLTKPFEWLFAEVHSGV